MKVYLVSLGCAKNLVDSEFMLGLLLSEGFNYTSVPDEADIIVVNTCGFLESAVEEAIETILEHATFKEKGSCKKLIVSGCMVQRYGKKLVKLLPEVDFFLGTSHYKDIISAAVGKLPQRILISSPVSYSHFQPRFRKLSTPPSFAYLKISEGCSNRCTFCYIPKLRGPFRSRPPDDIIEEAKYLDRQGITELVLIAQDVASYGMDFGNGNALIELLSRLEKLTNSVRWIRLLYMHPDNIRDELIKFVRDSDKVLPYIDVPLQHCSYNILKAMGRKGLGLFPERVIDKIRTIYPEMVIRTSFIVGFPGETRKDFDDLIKFVEDTGFDHVGVFAYSPEVGTKAASLPDQVSEPEREKRRAELYNIQRRISRSKIRKYIGKVVDAIVDGIHPECEYLLTGRLISQAPEVDGKVIFVDGSAKPGEIVTVQITDVHDYDVLGRIVVKEKEF